MLRKYYHAARFRKAYRASVTRPPLRRSVGALDVECMEWRARANLSDLSDLSGYAGEESVPMMEAPLMAERVG
jgi:hypothetical protein